MRTRKRAFAARGTAAFLWGLAFFALAQAVLSGLFQLDGRFKDPEFARKMAMLRRLVATKAVDQPLVILLGSSRVSTGVRPDYMPHGPGTPAVFNFGMWNARPVLQLVCLRRILEQGIRPDRFLIEMYQPSLLDLGAHESEIIDPCRLSRPDLALVAGYDPKPAKYRRHWLRAQIVPASECRTLLLNQLLPTWLTVEDCYDESWDHIDAGGWLRVTRFGTPQALADWPQLQRAFNVRYSAFQHMAEDRPLSAEADRAIRAMLGICRQQSIPVDFLLTPDPLLDVYSPQARTRTETYVTALSKEYDAGIIDTRHWMDPGDFHDLIHLTPAAAAAYSERLGKCIPPSGADFQEHRSPSVLPDGGSPQARLSKPGRPVIWSTLGDADERNGFSLEDCRGKTAVVVFLGTECPINNAYVPRLIELHQEFAGRGVVFVGINANCTDSAERVAAHAQTHGIPFPVLKDPGNSFADALGAGRTPEAFVIDRSGAVRYHGRIDDQYGIGYQRIEPTRRDLAEALQDVLGNQPVRVPTTPVAGCAIARVGTGKTDGAITFTRDIAPILQDHCQECHRPGQAGPMPLLTYEDAAGWAETIQEVVRQQRMPPWYADAPHGKFSNDRRLSPQERARLIAWAADGCPRGDPHDLPPPRAWPDWQIGTPDLVLAMPEAFTVPAESPRSGIPYQHFFIETGFKEDRWVACAEARAGTPEVVHHLIVFVLSPGTSFDPNDPSKPMLCAMAPGDMPLVLPHGMAKRIPAGARLVIEAHYTANGKAHQDRSEVGLVFAPPPQYEVQAVPIINAAFRIPPGADHHLVESSSRVRQDARLVSFLPHMHLRGKDFLYEAIYPNGTRDNLLSVPQFNFNWQSVYRLTEPQRLPAGTRLHCVAHFDNSSKNPNNPDPTQAIYWGPQTWDEMMCGWVDLAYPR